MQYSQLPFLCIQALWTLADAVDEKTSDLRSLWQASFELSPVVMHLQKCKANDDDDDDDGDDDDDDDDT